MIHEEICRRLSIPPMENSDTMIAETREISRMIGGLVTHIKDPQ
jgi:hypothetical protein